MLLGQSSEPIRTTPSEHICEFWIRFLCLESVHFQVSLPWTPQGHSAFASTWSPVGWAPKGVISFPPPLLHFHVYFKSLNNQAGNMSSSIHFTITNSKYYFKCVIRVLICQIFIFCGEKELLRAHHEGGRCLQTWPSAVLQCQRRVQKKIPVLILAG